MTGSPAASSTITQKAMAKGSKGKKGKGKGKPPPTERLRLKPGANSAGYRAVLQVRLLITQMVKDGYLD